MFKCKLFGEPNTVCKADTVLSFVYAHGKLQDKLGHDILAYNSKEQMLPMSADYPEGVWPVTVVSNDNKTEYQCVCFIWRKFAGVSTGLVILCDDVENLRYAAEKFATKAIMA